MAQATSKKRKPRIAGVWLDPAELSKPDVASTEVATPTAPLPLNAAYEQWNNAKRSKATAGPLLVALTPTIDAALKSYAGGDDQLRTRASIMAIDAAGRYSPKTGVQLSTYVSSYLRGLNREFAKRSQMVHIPEGSRLEWLKLEKASRDLEIEHGREPTLDELADNTSLSIKKIERLRKQNRGEASESQLLTEQGDTLFARTDDPQRIWADYVYHELDPVDKKIYEWSTGFGGSATLKKMDIAKRLKISAPAVSARINKIITRLQEGANA